MVSLQAQVHSGEVLEEVKQPPGFLPFSNSSTSRHSTPVGFLFSFMFDSSSLSSGPADRSGSRISRQLFVGYATSGSLQGQVQSKEVLDDVEQPPGFLPFSISSTSRTSGTVFFVSFIVIPSCMSVPDPVDLHRYPAPVKDSQTHRIPKHRVDRGSDQRIASS